ncbi:MAG: hypothetical protein M1833_007137 [Piccolia ochrophora]|nr:MAG: hypothetical protein M1833_007137 [Piccolia ochrophora]
MHSLQSLLLSGLSLALAAPPSAVVPRTPDTWAPPNNAAASLEAAPERTPKENYTIKWSTGPLIEYYKGDGWIVTLSKSPFNVTEFNEYKQQTENVDSAYFCDLSGSELDTSVPGFGLSPNPACRCDFNKVDGNECVIKLKLKSGDPSPAAPKTPDWINATLIDVGFPGQRVDEDSIGCTAADEALCRDARVVV